MAEPIRVGILHDMSDGPPAVGGLEPWLRRELDALIATGRIDRPVEFVHGWGLGLPSGSAAKVERAFADLAAQDPLLIIGPAIGDNALVATPLADHYGIPTINWAGAERGRSKYMFHLQVGSHEDESLVIARHLAGLGARRLGVVYDRSPIGRRHLQFLQAEAEIIGLEIAVASGISPIASQAEEQAGQVLAAKPDAVVYLGLGISASVVALALSARGWSGPRIMNTAGIRGYAAEFARNIEGWMYIDMHADGNATLNALCARLNVPEPGRLAAAKGYDLGRLAAEGLARADSLTREGVREGLEQIKWLPAAEGHEGTVLGFGLYDRGALHGRYLVVRQWLNEKSVQQAVLF